MAQKLFGITIGKSDPYQLEEKVVVEKKKSSLNNITSKVSKLFTSKKNKNTLSPEEEQKRKENISYTFQHALPATNSMNPVVLGNYANKDLISKFVKTGIVVASVFALMFAGNTINTWVQNRGLDDLRTIGEVKTSTIGNLNQYAQYKTNVSTEITAVAAQLVNDVDVQQIINFTYGEAAKQGINLTSVNVKISTSSTDTGNCMPSDPFATNTSFIGCVTVEGNQPTDVSVINFFNSIKAHKGFQDTFISSTTYGTEKNTFIGSYSFTSDLFSQRYTAMKAQTIDSILQNGLNIGKPATGTPTATTAPTATANPTPTTTASSTPAPTASATPIPTPTTGNK